MQKEDSLTFMRARSLLVFLSKLTLALSSFSGVLFSFSLSLGWYRLPSRCLTLSYTHILLLYAATPSERISLSLSIVNSAGQSSTEAVDEFVFLSSFDEQ